jgi:hypothetical protein
MMCEQQRERALSRCRHAPLRTTGADRGRSQQIAEKGSTFSLQAAFFNSLFIRHGWRSVKHHGTNGHADV